MTARTGNGLGFIACCGLLGYAYYAQYALRLEPCPLCIFQRLGIAALGAVFLFAALLPLRKVGRLACLALADLAALFTAVVAVRHLYIQSLPPGSIPACGASLKFMLQVLPLSEVLSKVLNGSGECAKVTWRFLGLSMPAWVLISSLALLAWASWSNLPRSRETGSA